MYCHYVSPLFQYCQDLKLAAPVPNRFTMDVPGPPIPPLRMPQTMNAISPQACPYTHKCRHSAFLHFKDLSCITSTTMFISPFGLCDHLWVALPSAMVIGIIALVLLLLYHFCCITFVSLLCHFWECDIAIGVDSHFPFRPVVYLNDQINPPFVSSGLVGKLTINCPMVRQWHGPVYSSSSLNMHVPLICHSHTACM